MNYILFDATLKEFQSDLNRYFPYWTGAFPIVRRDHTQPATFHIADREVSKYEENYRPV